MTSLQSLFCRQFLHRNILKVKFKDVLKIQKADNFYEANRKGGYNTVVPKKPSKIIRQGLGEIKEETYKWVGETTQRLKCDDYIGPIIHGDYELFYQFNDEKSVNQWVITTDKDHKEGKSEAQFILGPNKRGIFKGVIDTEVPKDGITKNSGYANIRAPKAMKSFKRSEPFDWTTFSHLILLVRGDGRPYQIVLAMDRYFDIQWNDQYSYPLFTHGGPYWQYVKIPFSKFMLSAKGRIQDKQEKVQLDKVSWVGITIADGYNGPFQLEIDWIGCVFDENHKEDFAYEMYKVSPSVFS